MSYRSNSGASGVGLARFDLRMIRAMQPAAARGGTGECVAKASPVVGHRCDRDVANAICGVSARHGTRALVGQPDVDRPLKGRHRVPHSRQVSRT
jgi:hypothetical protein